MPYQRAVEPAEIAQLQATYGPFPVERVDVHVQSAHFFESARTPLGTSRRGEVLLVVVAPDGHVLVHTKRFYPPGVYRLITGGIGIGEPVEQAVERELVEETGQAPLSRCFIGVLVYRIHYQGESLTFASYAYRVDVSTRQVHPMDEDEEIADFRWIAPAEIPAVQAHLQHVPPEWQDWGRFRALGHDFVLRHGSRCGLSFLSPSPHSPGAR